TAAKRAPKTGALGLSLLGGVGMFSTSIFQPIIGGWIDQARTTYTNLGMTGSELDLASGQATLTKMVFFPLILIVLFSFFYIWQRRKAMNRVSPEMTV